MKMIATFQFISTDRCEPAQFYHNWQYARQDELAYIRKEITSDHYPEIGIFTVDGMPGRWLGVFMQVSLHEVQFKGVPYNL